MVQLASSHSQKFNIFFTYEIQFPESIFPRITYVSEIGFLLESHYLWQKFLAIVSLFRLDIASSFDSLGSVIFKFDSL